MLIDPQVSILISSYNHGPFIEDAVRSALSQEDVSLEVLVVDDGSQDDSLDRLGRIEDARLRVFAQENRGLSRAMNRILQIARGDWIKFLPSDDLLLPGCLQQQLQEAPGFVATFCRPSVVDRDLVALRDPQPEAWFDLDPDQGDPVAAALIERNPLSAPCALFDRQAALQVGGFDPAFRVAQDYDLWLKLASRGSLHVSGARLVQVRWHGANQSAVATVATEAERATALVGALARDGLPRWIERYATKGRSAGEARRALFGALLRSGLSAVGPFARTLALEMRRQGDPLPKDPSIAAFLGLAPDGGRPEAGGDVLAGEQF